MKWASYVSEQQNLKAAVEECASQLRESFGQDRADLAVVFVSPHFSADYESVPRLIQDSLAPHILFGCSAGGVIGGGKEVENRPGFSLTLARLPDVEVSTFHVIGDDLPDMDAPPEEWETAIGISPEGGPKFLLLADPFSFPAQSFIEGMDYAFRGAVKVGGLASGGSKHGENALYMGGTAHRSGAIGIALKGNVALDTVVAQGCRPISSVMSITKSRKNLLLELDQRPALEVLKEVFVRSNERDRELIQHSLFLGIAMDDFLEEPQQGDFLIRNIIGLDSSNSVLAIGEMLREGQRVQFHLRDKAASAEDLAALLSRYAGEERATPCEGALLFSCLGRGEYLYGRPDHDTELFRDKVGTLPLGGFFCNGEIGPVGGTTFLHGYTSSFGIFRPLQVG